MIDAKTLLDNFEVIPEAPGGVQRLRELILQLAVRGRLTERSASDGSPQEVLTLVRSRRDILISEGKLRRSIKTNKPWFSIDYARRLFALIQARDARNAHGCHFLREPGGRNDAHDGQHREPGRVRNHDQVAGRAGEHQDRNQ